MLAFGSGKALITKVSFALPQLVLLVIQYVPAPVILIESFVDPVFQSIVPLPDAHKSKLLPGQILVALELIVTVGVELTVMVCVAEELPHELVAVNVYVPAPDT
jgi:hypothetical protein